MDGERTAVYSWSAFFLLLEEGGLVTLGQRICRCARSVTAGYNFNNHFRGEQAGGVGPRR